MGGSSLIHSAWLNQQGASLLLTRDVEQAALFFKQALEVVRSDSRDMLHPSPPLIIPTGPAGRQFACLEKNRGFVYFKPFFFNQDATFNEQDIASYNAIMTFNLALCYHLEGQCFRDGGGFLATAKSLYQNALELLNHDWQYDCSNVMIASLNNLACVQSDLLKVDESCQTLLLLSTFINEGRVRTDTLSKDDLRDIVLNICLLPMACSAGVA